MLYVKGVLHIKCSFVRRGEHPLELVAFSALHTVPLVSNKILHSLSTSVIYRLKYDHRRGCKRRVGVFACSTARALSLAQF